MDMLANFARQLRDTWERSNNTYRLAFIAAAVSVVATMAGVGFWASRPQYIPLAENLTPTESAAVMDRLQSQNIPAKLSFSGATVLVPEAQWSDANLAANDVLGESSPSSETTSTTLFPDPATKKFQMNREKELHLARTIARLRIVSSAEVHLALPEPAVFTRERVPAKASVMVGTRRGATLMPEHGETIAAMVASGVEGLSKDNVTVTDLNGYTIYPNSLSADGGRSRHYHFKQQLESDLSEKAEQVLASSLGPGRAIVRVTADLDFTEEQREETRYDPDGQVKTSEKIDSTESTGGANRAAGVAGSGSNLNATGGSISSANGGTMKQESIDAKYEHSKTHHVIKEFGGDILRLSVSAIVDLPTAEDTNEASVAAIDLAKAEDLIRKAVGFDEKRGDAITVTQAPITGPAVEMETVLDTLNRWDFYNNLVRNASLGLAAVVALVLGLLLIRKLQPMGPIDQPSTDAGRTSLMDELSAQARENPEVVSQIVNAWLNSPTTVPMTRPEQPKESDEQPRRQAA